MKTKSKTLEIAKSMVKWDLNTGIEGSAYYGDSGTYYCTIQRYVTASRLSLKQRNFITSLISQEKKVKSEPNNLFVFIDDHLIEFRYGQLAISYFKTYEGEEAILNAKKWGFTK